MDPFEWLAGLRRDVAEWRRDDARRDDQGTRDGYARSGEPSPIPVYAGPPSSGGQRAGIETAYVTGTGAAAYADINNRSDKRSWVYHAVYATIGGVTSPVDTDYFIRAQDGAALLAIVYYHEQGVAHDTKNYAHVPCTRLRIMIPVSTLNVLYQITGIWEEDR